ncbi:TPA: flippase [Enterococcus faecium]|uniref:flippase n=1 Tax=Enterococcus faecium TaxID=1352 RepID=UPI00145A7103|nr:flippase [Enterococcus faecium]MCH3236890.1 flippase [Enterococcus faecium]MCZ1310298.1 flippase [Enterococcus faecium]MCZ1359049.1 flippase [Enterococcus faecium]NMO48157.1 flippase [Enterococcus faecium]HBM5401553.1 flippase [Enterococcus faecium]
MKEKSLSINAILNGLKSILGILFPLITLPYATRILQVENIGKVNFSYSIVNYFVLLAALGISSYATREGAKIRDNKAKFEKFASEILSLNIISTLISYICLFFALFVVDKFKDYTLLIIVQSASIFFTTLGVNWLYQVYEEYIYITIRTIAVQIVSLCLMFILVKDSSDYVLYAAITVISNSGANLFNFYNARKYCKFKFTITAETFSHLKLVLIFFASNIAVTIYINSDTTMLGLLSSDYSVGLYTIAVKVYTILKTLISSVTIVALPRLSFYLAKKDYGKYEDSVGQMFNYLALIMFPVCVGLNVVSDGIIFILGGESYMEAALTLHIQSVSLIFSSIATIFTNAVMLPNNKEKIVFYATFTGAGLNIGLNYFLILAFNQNGAALATMISEILVCTILFIGSRKIIRIRINLHDMVTVFLGCLGIVCCAKLVDVLALNIVADTICTCVLGVVLYFIIMKLAKHSEIEKVTNAVLKKFK